MGNVETMRTSSCRREVGSENHPKSVGCMSGIFHFISTHHGRSRKRLTSAKRKETKTMFIPATAGEVTPPRPEIEGNVAKKTEPRRISIEVPRCPAIQQEIRRKRPPTVAVNAAASPDCPRHSPVLLARLMGLEEAPTPQAAAEKLRELLRALEKCDEDLKALRRIIEEARSAEVKSDNSKPVSLARTAGRLLEKDGVRESKSNCNGEQPSPVSVLDAISSPRYRPKRSPDDKQGTTAAGSRIVKPSRTGVLFTLGDHKKKMEVMPRATMERMERGWRRRERRGVSRAMAETVEEVWEEGAWEEKWEMGRVGMWVEVDILWDLVEELVGELFGLCRKLSPPRRSCCRKRLRF